MTGSLLSKEQTRMPSSPALSLHQSPPISNYFKTILDPEPTNQPTMSSSSTSIAVVFVLFVLFLAPGTVSAAGGSSFQFSFEGFKADDLNCSRGARITSSGLVQLTQATEAEIGYAFYPIPITKSNSSSSPTNLAFSTTFVFAIVRKYPDVSGHGITFAMTPTLRPTGQGTEFLGIFDTSGKSNDTIVVEFDTYKDNDIGDMSNNHVGFDANNVRSFNSTNASYFDVGTNDFESLTLSNGKLVQVWIEYDGEKMAVTLAPVGVSKPQIPLMVSRFDVWSNLSDRVYVGFSAATASGSASHYLLGWSFALDGEARALDLANLPVLPKSDTKKNNTVPLLAGSISLLLAALLLIIGFVMVRRRRKKYKEILEDWEVEYGPIRLSYRDLYKATDGFKDDNILGGGGFGVVYKGVLWRNSQPLQVAVKKVHHRTGQGMKEFIAEIATIGRLRHRNLVQLLGYCRREGELILVYDYMPNGSLDKLLFTNDNRFTPDRTLSWKQRFDAIRGVAEGLLYLHEGWEQVVIHRDIKAANVLLDQDFNPRLSDFGLARLYDHGSNPATTCVVGTFGYLAPELTRTGKATTKTDIYAFGCLLLEVVCGRRPMESTVGVSEEESDLLDWTLECWKQGVLFNVVDKKLKGEYVAEEVEKVLRLGLLCSHPDPNMRPYIRQGVEMLKGVVPLPEMSPNHLSESCLEMRRRQGFDDVVEYSRHLVTEEVMIESEIELSPSDSWMSLV